MFSYNYNVNQEPVVLYYCNVLLYGYIVQANI